MIGHKRTEIIRVNTIWEPHVVTAAKLRSVIRSKLDNGLSRQTISDLIAEHVPPEALKRRGEGRARRVPVELIPLDQRVAFLAALARASALSPAN